MEAALIKNFKFFIIQLYIGAIILCGFSTYASPPKYSNEFLSIGVGARSLAMANAYSSVTNDVTSGYWNPAGLLHIQSNLQLGFMHSQYFAGLARYDYGGIAIKANENNHIGFSYIRFGVDDIPDTSELIDAEGNINYDRIRSFNASDNAFIISFARKMPEYENLFIGANAKVIRRTAGSFAGAWGFGLDIGAIYKMEQWQFALVGRDITTTFNAWTYNLDDSMREVFTITGNEIPSNSYEVTLPRFILGTSREFEFKNDISLLASLDINITTDGKRNVLIPGDPFSIEPALGFELGYKKIVFLRGGIGNFQEYYKADENLTYSIQPNIGVGIVIGDILYVDYALTNVGNSSIALYSNVFSIKLNINRRDSDKIKE
ncbi:MAG: PorV/PorQ family protein [Bacteroidetes bacterium]|nr:PorV/PorQ family protein [Bacteroidota bacterium]